MTETSAEEPRFEIDRITVVRVSGTLDARAVGHLERICRDLIHDHGVAHLLLDLTSGYDPESLVPAVVESVDAWMTERGSSLELRLPSSPTEELIELANDVVTFAVVDPTDGS